MARFLGTLTVPALSSAPAVGVAGSLYYNTTSSTLFQSNGTAWSAVGGGGTGGASVSDTAPSSPSTGQLWFKSDTGQTFVYFDSTWVEIGVAGQVGTAPSSDDLWFFGL